MQKYTLNHYPALICKVLSKKTISLKNPMAFTLFQSIDVCNIKTNLTSLYFKNIAACRYIFTNFAFHKKQELTLYF